MRGFLGRGGFIGVGDYLGTTHGLGPSGAASAVIIVTVPAAGGAVFFPSLIARAGMAGGESDGDVEARERIERENAILETFLRTLRTNERKRRATKLHWTAPPAPPPARFSVERQDQNEIMVAGTVPVSKQAFAALGVGVGIGVVAGILLARAKR